MYLWTHGAHTAAGLQLGGSESYPGVFQPFGGFADCIPVIQGRTRLHDTPGIGIELKPELEHLLDLDICARNSRVQVSE